MISGIYSDPVEELLTDEKVVFKNSFDNAGFRYYNFKSTSPALTKSLDWGIIADEKILVIATSKEMATEISSQLLDNSPDFMETSTENEPSSTNSTLEDSSGDADADNSSYEIENSSSDLPSESLTDEKVLNNASVD
jgi:hypothetical protein